MLCPNSAHVELIDWPTSSMEDKMDGVIAELRLTPPASESVEDPWTCPKVVEPDLPEDVLLTFSHLSESGEMKAAVRNTAVTLFDVQNQDAIGFAGQRAALEQERDTTKRLLCERADELVKLTPHEVHYSGEAAFQESWATGVGVWALYLLTLLSLALGMSNYATWVVATQQFETIKTLLDALPLSGVTFSAFVGIPLAAYATMTDDAERARFFKKVQRLGLKLGTGALVCFTASVFLSTFLLDATGHAPHGALLRQIMGMLPFAHSLTFALQMPFTIGAEAAASVALKIWAGRLQQRSRKRVVITNPGCDATEAQMETRAERLTWLGKALAEIASLEKTLEVGREAFVSKCVATVQELQHRQRHASDGARLGVTKTDPSARTGKPQNKAV
jgi:hypothetical protein